MFESLIIFICAGMCSMCSMLFVSDSNPPIIGSFHTSDLGQLLCLFVFPACELDSKVAYTDDFFTIPSNPPKAIFLQEISIKSEDEIVL